MRHSQIKWLKLRHIYSDLTILVYGMTYAYHALLVSIERYVSYIPYFCYWIGEGDYEQTISGFIENNHRTPIISRKFC